MHQLLDIFLHLPKYLDQFVLEHGSLTYWVLIAIVFCETGLVVLPFLPGDSLLFAAGAVAARPATGLNIGIVAVTLILAAIVGDTVNYHAGKIIGPTVMKSESSRLFNKAHLEKTGAFFDKYGGKTIILARFVPIVRTFAPFVAGAGAMNYSKFILFNVIGAVAWVTLMLGSGWFLGQLPFFQKHFEMVVIGIVLLSVLPMVVEYLKARGQKPAEELASLPSKR